MTSDLTIPQAYQPVPFGMLGALLVGLGGAAGAGLRWGIVEAMTDGAEAATTGVVLGCNVAGSLLLGVVIARWPSDHRWRWLLGTGFCGGLTTLSSFALEVAQRLDRADVGEGLGLAVATAVACCVAAAVGFRLGRRTNGGRR